jgi:5'-nucleotidase
MTSPARILLANDDGIQAPGLRALAAALGELAEVWVVAPDREQSATSHSISLHRPLRMRKLAEREYSVDGTPTDSVYLALHHVMPHPPDIVVSGINDGPNLGNDVLYSGTVSAAMEGALFGYRAVAVSLCLPEIREEVPRVRDFGPAASVAQGIVRSVLAKPMPRGVLLNVNVPSLPLAEIGGMKLCRLGYTDWSDAVDVRHDPRGKAYYWIGGSRDGHDDIEDSDNKAIAAGYVAVTPIHYDITDYRSFAYARGLEVEGFAHVPDALGNSPLPHPLHPKARKKGRG